MACAWVWDTLDATIVLGQDIIQPALRTPPTSNAPHPAPSIHAPRETNHLMAELHLPATLPSLFADLPRTLEVEAGTVNEAIDRLDQRWPGMRDRLCEPGPQLRRHINIYVDRERAELETRLEHDSRVDVIAAISGG
jgi:sulfur-carrier protein